MPSRHAGSFPKTVRWGWDPVAEGNRAGDGMACKMQAIAKQMLSAATRISCLRKKLPVHRPYIVTVSSSAGRWSHRQSNLPVSAWPVLASPEAMRSASACSAVTAGAFTGHRKFQSTRSQCPATLRCNDTCRVPFIDNDFQVIFDFLHDWVNIIRPRCSGKI